MREIYSSHRIVQPAVCSKMADVVWAHSSEGFDLRIATREAEVTLGSNLPVSSMDVCVDRGQSPGLAAAAAQPLDTQATPAADTPVF